MFKIIIWSCNNDKNLIRIQKDKLELEIKKTNLLKEEINTQIKLLEEKTNTLSKLSNLEGIQNISKAKNSLESEVNRSIFYIKNIKIILNFQMK